MTIARFDRLMPQSYCGYFFKALEIQMGAHSLQIILSGSGMDDLIPADTNFRTGCNLYASQFAAVQFAIRQYYGSGAHGLFTRVGRQLWHELIRDGALSEKIKFFFVRFSTRDNRCQKVLEYMAHKLAQPLDQFSIHVIVNDMIFVDRTSDSTYGQSSDSPICWITTGIIQEGLFSVIGKDIDVEEFTCLAAGAEACKFRIRL